MFSKLFDEAMHAVRIANDWAIRDGALKQGPRYWFIKQSSNHDLHPLIHKIVHNLEIRPKAWQNLLLEWPHVSESDPKRLAYTRSEEYGQADCQTVTSIGKYLARHWPHIPDHTRRNWLASFCSDRMEFVWTKQEIIVGIELGPRSCMASKSDSIPFGEDDHAEMLNWLEDKANSEPNWDTHPYATYAPEYGWGMALRYTSGMDGKERIEGRALVNSEKKCYVRTYQHGETDGCRSEEDYKLKAWLETQGYQHKSGWPRGLKLAKIDSPTQYGYLFPYIDGSADEVDECGDYLVLVSDGDYKCSCIDGSADEGSRRETIGECDDCNVSLHEDDDYSNVGIDGESRVCSSCASCYTSVRGPVPRGIGRLFTYLIPDDNAVYVNGEHYDPSNLPEEIWQTEGGDYISQDDAVYIGGDCYDINDGKVIVVEEECDEDGRHALKDDCWQDVNGDWHRDDIECIEHDGENYTQEQFDDLDLEGTSVRQEDLKLETT